MHHVGMSGRAVLTGQIGKIIILEARFAKKILLEITQFARSMGDWNLLCMMPTELNASKPSVSSFTFTGKLSFNF